MNNTNVRKDFEREKHFEGVRLYDQKKYVESLECITSVLENDQHSHLLDVENLLYAGKCLFQMKNYPESLIFFENTLKHFPNHELGLLMKGRCLFEMKKYDYALNCFEDAIKTNQNNPTTWHWKGKCLSELKRYEESYKCDSKSTDLYLESKHNASETNDDFEPSIKGTALTDSYEKETS
jgi:tetratricopeptide (TPR) repeat protein